MLINDVDINSFEAKQLTVDIQAGDITNNNSWARNFLTPVLSQNKTTFSVLKVELLINGTNREDCLIKCNKIISLCLKNAANIIKLDKYKRYFIGSLTEHKEEKTKAQGKFKMTLSFQGYVEGADLKTVDITSIGNINNNESTTETPCKIILVSTSDVTTVTIKINDRQITVKNITKNVPIVLDGITGKFTQTNNNKFSDIDLWDFPYLDIGNNEITCDKEYCTLTIQYKNRYI